MKNYEILVTATLRMIITKVHNEEEALEKASDLADLHRFEIQEYSVGRELSDQDTLERAKRHADQIC